MESSIAGKLLGTLVDNKVTRSQQWTPVAKVVNSVLGCVRQNVASSTGVTHLECCVQAGLPQYEGHMGRVQWKVTKLMKRVEHLSYNEMLRELELFGLQKLKIIGESYQ